MSYIPHPGLRIFTCAHSFHDFVPALLAEMADGAGIKEHKTIGMSGIGGSTVSQHWDVPDEQNETKHAICAGEVDVLTLSPIWLPDDGIENFARLTMEHNKLTRVLVQEFWLPNDEYVPIYPLQTDKEIDHNAINGSELRERHAPFFHDMDNYLSEINNRLAKEILFAVPVGQAVIALREKIIANEAPGLHMQAELFTDSWGHPSAPVKVLSAYCHFAVCYKCTPQGLPLPSLLQQNPLWNDDLNHLLQELAWNSVVFHPLSGVTI